MFKYKEKTAFTYNIQSVVHCRKFSMKLVFHLNHYRKCITFKDIFPGLSRTSSFNFKDFPEQSLSSRVHGWAACGAVIPQT